MTHAFGAALAYFAAVFAAGFVLGTIRVFLLAPRMSEFAAVAVELPFMLAISWAACALVIREFEVADDVGTRLAMGGIAFTLLLAAELALGFVAFDRTFADQFAAWTALAGALGLAGQIAFALFPLMMRRKV